MTMKILSQVRVTAAQREWLESELLRTGDTFASTIRKMIQDKIETKKERE